MNLKRVNHFDKSKSFFKQIVCCMLICALLFVGVSANAASKHTTRPAISVEEGDWNPTKHDQVKCYVDFCTRHAKKPNSSKVTISYQVKSSAKKTKTVSFNYYSTIVGTKEGAPTYTEYNKGKQKVATLKTLEDDKYTVYGRYCTADCYCVTCQSLDLGDAENYCNLGWCKWKKE